MHAKLQDTVGIHDHSAVVARHSAFGGSFTDLAELEPGDFILITTTQGQTVYETTEVHEGVRLLSDDQGSGPPRLGVLNSPRDFPSTMSIRTAREPIAGLTSCARRAR